MFKNTFYDTYNDTMHLWYQTESGENKYKSQKWVPYIYKKDDDGDVNTIYGEKARKITFSTYKDYQNFQKLNKQDIFENNMNPNTQYLVEKYYKVNDDDIIPPKLKIYSIDIEVHVKNNIGEFPDPIRAEEPIIAITIYDWNKKHFFTFGLHEYDNKREDVTYIYCKDKEEILLRKFFAFTYKNAPDVYTGWNIVMNKKMQVSGFDFPYIINRSVNVLGDKSYNYLSPIKKVRSWNTKDGIGVNVSGVSLLDYQTIFKWFTTKNLEKYTLDYVCDTELGEKKLKYDGSLSDLYNNDWQKYIDYNIRDTELIKLLDDKLGYLNLVQSLSLLTRAQMESFIAMTVLLEGKLLLYYRRNNMCAPFFKGGTQTSFPAAYVKDPQKGLWDWIMSIDIASSYPTAIITLNMSIETYIGRIIGLTEDNVIYYTEKKEFPPFMLSKNGLAKEINNNDLKKFNLMISKGYIAIAPCGTCFKTVKPGILAIMEREMFVKRKGIKKEMFNCYGSDNKIIPEKKDEQKRLHAFQWALKILLNSMFGIMAVPYSRYFLLDIAEAITSCGRHTIKQGEKFTNEILNDIMNPDLLKIINEIKEK